MKTVKPYWLLLFVFCLCLLLIIVQTGCVRVKPWERDIMAKKVMSFESEQEENTLDHTYYNAREGAAGGFESGGGGCGCN